MTYYEPFGILECDKCGNLEIQANKQDHYPLDKGWMHYFEGIAPVMASFGIGNYERPPDFFTDLCPNCRKVLDK